MVFYCNIYIETSDIKFTAIIPSNSLVNMNLAVGISVYIHCQRAMSWYYWLVSVIINLL